MACNLPDMAQRKKPGTSGGNTMATQGPASCPTPHPAESCDLKALPTRQRPLRYHKESHDMKTLSNTRKAQCSCPKSQDVGRNHSEEDANTEVEVKRYSKQDADAELENQRPATPSTPEHNHNIDDQADFNGGADSLDDDSSSDYINNTSDDEEDYDDGECNFSHQVVRILRSHFTSYCQFHLCLIF